MQYFEDIMELIEDIPEEICKRFELMRKWDSDVERLQLECRYAVKRILELTETSETMREKILMELADVNDSSYLCKIELEVDNPGCTDAIERNFCRMLGLRPTSSHLAKCNVEFEPLDDVESTSSFQEEDIFGGCSPSDSRDGAFPNMSNGTADMESLESFSQRSVSYGNPPSSLASAPKFKVCLAPDVVCQVSFRTKVVESGFLF
ncbi:unnamed protein product [Angiostrongylus costaricensis]|uniref:ING domain-containing protein n=1 Tax=Angiostrongylus costaricensis TaxID=334426 RepID=A0A0R3PE34_ANGCS|nr:unnamed protein product [Angiostrongylus costaricensis]